MHYYFGLQFSGIQRVIMRYERLWAMSGTSHILSSLNEIRMPMITEKNNGTVILAGGGKFTARFENEEDARRAREAIIKEVSTTLPMLEFQITPVIPANSFKEARDAVEEGDQVQPGIVSYLNDMKRTFRGYGVTFNPHLQLCEECSSYPATFKDREGVHLCRFCYDAKHTRINIKQLLGKSPALTSIERVYAEYLRNLPGDPGDVHIPLNFADLFHSYGGDNNTNSSEERNRMAVWVSDLNNMNKKVPIWLNEEEGRVLQIFKKVTDTNVQIISSALKKTFPPETINTGEKNFLPFRLIVAGGDDLCIVMPARYILKFAKNYHETFEETKKKLNNEPNHPLNEKYFKNESTGPYCFGSAFIVTDIHTPFSFIHSKAEELMKEAKEESKRKENSINWQVMSTGDDPYASIVKFDRPISFIKFTEYYDKCVNYQNISSSRIYQLAQLLMRYSSDPEGLKRALLKIPEVWKNSSHLNQLMKDDFFKDSSRNVSVNKLATFLELLTLYREGNDG